MESMEAGRREVTPRGGQWKQKSPRFGIDAWSRAPGGKVSHFEQDVYKGTTLAYGFWRFSVHKHRSHTFLYLNHIPNTKAPSRLGE